MNEQEVVRQEMLGRVSDLFRESTEKAVTARIRKYRSSNDSLRKELAATKQGLEGMRVEFQPQVDRAASAEKTVKHQEARIEELKLTIEALQTQNLVLNKKLTVANMRKKT